MPVFSAGDVMLEDGITNSVQLLGKFLMCRSSGMSQEHHCNKFYLWLRHSKLIHSNCNTIVQSCAEKANVLIPGLYHGKKNSHKKYSINANVL